MKFRRSFGIENDRSVSWSIRYFKDRIYFLSSVSSWTFQSFFIGKYNFSVAVASFSILRNLWLNFSHSSLISIASWLPKIVFSKCFLSFYGLFKHFRTLTPTGYYPCSSFWKVLQRYKSFHNINSIYRMWQNCVARRHIPINLTPFTC